ncbi:hypothetical protein [Burkholderia sp. 22PA0106]|uniref:hypothetical protein n=1 Tax=Burkholderia sp. 22PA0106 TaxID=3237371 RepID=UPI0039C13C95
MDASQGACDRNGAATWSRLESSLLSIGTFRAAAAPIFFRPLWIAPQPTSGGAYAIPLAVRYTRTTGTVAAVQGAATDLRAVTCGKVRPSA